MPEGPLPTVAELGAGIMARCDALAELSEQPDGLTRTFGTDRHRAALDLIAGWMGEAGMAVRQDASGNLIGRYEAAPAGAPCIMLGSHQDTVRDGGRYDGMLGIVAPLAAVATLHRQGRRLPTAVELIVFGDEEGVRFQTTLLGSKAVAGTFDPATLATRDADGVSVAQAMRAIGGDPDRIASAARRPGEVLAFVETHIEQGPVLEAEGLPVGVVTAIAGGSRLAITLEGEAGHAGTVPMDRRRDALCAAADAVLTIERHCRAGSGLVGTVGRLTASPGAINVIPGRVSFTADIRAAEDAARRTAVAEIREKIEAIAATRGVTADIETLYESDGATCAPPLVERLEAAIAATGHRPRRLMSGAGHDAMAMAALCPVAMLFVRCEKGISHNPAEAITAEDAGTAAQVLLHFLDATAARPLGGDG